jgi:hypothetical protein
MSVYDSNTTDYVFLWNTGSKAITLYAGNSLAVAPKNGLPSIMIRFNTSMQTFILGFNQSGV